MPWKCMDSGCSWSRLNECEAITGCSWKGLIIMKKKEMELEIKNLRKEIDKLKSEIYTLRLESLNRDMVRPTQSSLLELVMKGWD